MRETVKRTVGGATMLAVLVIGASVALAQNTVLLEDDFEGVAAGTPPDNTLWPTQGQNVRFPVTDNGTNPFGSPNQYMNWNDDDATSTGSVRMQSGTIPEITGAITTFAFDFVEPDGGGNGDFLIGYSIAGGDINTAGRCFVVALDDGTLKFSSGGDETGTTSYALNAVHRLFILLNNTATPVEGYFDGQTLDPGEADVWLVPLGESPVFAGSGALTAAGDPARVGFRTFSSTLQNVFVDNVVLADGVAGPGLNDTPPNIIVQPQDIDLVLGETQAVFSVGALGVVPLAYQWSRDGSVLPGETNSTLILLDPRAADEAAFSVVVTNSLGSATSDPATLTLVAAPIEPGNQAGVTGSSVTFSIAMPAASTGYAYQWLRNGGAVAGATGPELVLYPLAVGDAGSYTVEVTLDGTTVTGGPASLLVAPPAAKAYPDTVLDDSPVAYWRLGEMTGAATAAETAGAAGGPFTGSYGPAVVLQQVGAILGDADAAAGFVGNSTSRVDVAFAEQLNPSTTFSVEAWALVDGGAGSERNLITSFDPVPGSGVEAYGYEMVVTPQNRWRFSAGRGYQVTGPTRTDLDGPTLTPLEWTHLVGVYDGGTFTFYVNGAPVATASEAFQPVDPFYSVPFYIGAGGVDDLTGVGDGFFQGLIDEVAIYGSALTQQRVLEHYAAGLPVDAEPRITVQPTDEQRDISGQVTFAVGVRAGGVPSFQWKKDGVDIPGAILDTLTLTDLDLTDAGDYRAVVTSGATAVPSDPATLTIRPPSIVLIDDFDTYPTGLVENVASPAWVVSLNGYYTIEEETPGGSRYFRARDDDGAGTSPTLVSIGDTNVSAGATNGVPDHGISTVFMRFYVEGAADGSLWFGMTDTQTGGFNAFEGYVNTTLPGGLTIRDSAEFAIAVTNLMVDTWYNMWQVQDNDSDTLQVYLTTQSRDATFADRLEVNGKYAFGFRNGTSDPLTYFQFISRSVAGGHRIDDIYVSTGVNLVNPVAAPSLGPVGISLQAGAPEISWTDPGTLQHTEDLNGTWTDLPGATSPYTPAAAPAEQFRLRQ